MTAVTKNGNARTIINGRSNDHGECYYFNLIMETMARVTNCRPEWITVARVFPRAAGWKGVQFWQLRGRP